MLNKSLLTAFLFSLSCAVTVAQASPQGATAAWRTFTPKGQEVSVELPGEPAHRVSKISKPGISITWDAYLLVTNSEAYLFGEVAMPPSETSLDERLEFGISHATARILAEGGKEISKSKITSSFGCPGVAWVGSKPRIPRYEIRAFATPERLYILAFNSRETEQASDNKASRFFDSFKVPGSPCDEKKAK